MKRITKDKNGGKTMKKLIAIIILLVIILVGIAVYKKVAIATQEIKIEEIERIENYLNQIYMWKEITNEALPSFETINQADEIWVWEVVKKNLEEYELTSERIEEKAKEIFGGKFIKKFPQEGTLYIVPDEENQFYYAIGTDLDQQEDLFLLNKIEKTKTGYEVEIVEYLEDYSQIEEQELIIIRNIEGEEVGRVSSQEEEKTKQLAKDNRDKLSKKRIILQEEKGRLVVEKVEKEQV